MQHKSAYLDGHILEVGKYTVHSTAHTSVMCVYCCNVHISTVLALAALAGQALSVSVVTNYSCWSWGALTLCLFFISGKNTSWWICRGKKVLQE